MKFLILGLFFFSCTETNYIKIKELTSQQFEGFYHLKNNGFIELIANKRGDINIINTNQHILSENPKNNTLAEHPRIYGSHLQILNNKLRWTRNEKYTGGHDLEEDINGNNILGVKRTDYLIELIRGKLKITVLIWSNKIGNNINNVIAKRIIKEE